MSNAIVITGHYGVGKTNFAVNLALDLKRKHPKSRITVCDLDIVNPYFRTADFSKIFSANNIRTAIPKFANSNLDIPAVNFDLSAELSDCDYLIIDVGGDDTGAIALGRYADILKSADSFSMLYVVNRYRCLTSTPEEAVELMYAIEFSSRLKHTAIVNNSNLGSQTDADIVSRSADFADAICRSTNLPLYCTALKKGIYAGVIRPFYCEIYVKTVWDS